MRLIITNLLVFSIALGYSQSLQTIDAKKPAEAVDKAWYLKSIGEVKAYGTESDRVRKELLVNMPAPKKKIVVAVIDSGVDNEHEDLKSNLWINQDEIAGNGIDDDANGYVDDINGWNFLVDSKGENIVYENMEATRVLRLSKDLQAAGKPYPDWLTKEVLENAAEIYNSSSDELNSMKQFAAVYKFVDSTLTSTFQDSNYTSEEVKRLQSNIEDVNRAKKVYEIFEKLGVDKSAYGELSTQVKHLKDYYLNFDFQNRDHLVFDIDSIYGNNYVGGKHTEHGTHVAGIIGASANNDLGIAGVAGNEALIMILKAVPDGDENDIDVAKAIRYAADNGANIINMSFGKGISPSMNEVYEALEYAASKNVLIIHAAGNDSKDIDNASNYPNSKGLTGSAKLSYMTIGALAPEKGKNMVASFSNYGKQEVDLFAPGQDIYATLPENGYDYRSGTSMAAPVVSGVAALVWAYHPEFTATQIRAILIESGVDLGKKKAVLPGDKKKVRFRDISVHGKVVSAYEAFVLASESGS